MAQAGQPAASCTGFNLPLLPEDEDNAQQLMERQRSESQAADGASVKGMYCFGVSIYDDPSKAAATGAPAGPVTAPVNNATSAGAPPVLPFCAGVGALVTSRAAEQRDGAVPAAPPTSAAPPPRLRTPPWLDEVQRARGRAQPSSSAAAGGSGAGASRTAGGANGGGEELAARVEKFAKTCDRVARRHIAKMESSIRAIAAAVGRKIE